MTTPTTSKPLTSDSTWEDTLAVAYGESLRWFDGLPSDTTAPTPDLVSSLRRLDRPLPTRGLPPPVVIADLVRDVTAGLRKPTSAGCLDRSPTQPVEIAAEWSATAWEASARHATTAPALAALERVTGTWVRDLFRLPRRSKVAFTADRTAAQFHCLIAARSRVLKAHESNRPGKPRTPEPVTLLVGSAHHHASDADFAAVGGDQGFVVKTVDSDSEGRMCPQRLRNALQIQQGPVIVVARAGHLETDATDPLAAIATAVETARSTRPYKGDLWLHLDGGRGLWAGISPRLRHHVEGYDRADSWAFDTDPWLNTTRQWGIAAARLDPDQRQPVEAGGEPSTGMAAESTRVVAMYAALRHAGQRALVESAERIHLLTRRAVSRLIGHDGVAVLSRSVLNRILLRCVDREGNAAVQTPAVAAALRRGELWHPVAVDSGGNSAIQLTVRNWLATEADVDRAVTALLHTHNRIREQLPTPPFDLPAVCVTGTRGSSASM